MNDPRIIDKVLHPNGDCAPYVASIVDDPEDGQTKLVISFEETGHTAVLFFDQLIDSEDVSKSQDAGKIEQELKEKLWG